MTKEEKETMSLEQLRFELKKLKTILEEKKKRLQEFVLYKEWNVADKEYRRMQTKVHLAEKAEKKAKGEK